MKLKNIGYPGLVSAAALSFASLSSYALDIPGKIEAEDATSRSGTFTEATTDNGGGLNVGNIKRGNSLSYAVDVASSGTYQLQLRVATIRTGTDIEVSVNGSLVGDIDVPTTGGWQDWTTINTEIELEAGDETITLAFGGTSGGGLLNVNWLNAVYIGENTVVMQKQNTSFAIDGNHGAVEGQQVYLWNTNTNNKNQQWIESPLGGEYYSYGKMDTPVCLDGGSGGSRRQPVTLEQCNDNDLNQHWRKVSLSNGSFRLEKRGTSYSIDGNRSAAQGQAIYLWDSSDANVNQQWEFFAEGVIATPTPAPTSTPTPTPNPNWNVASLAELRDAVSLSNQDIVMKAGSYNMTELPSGSRNFLFSGSNNTIDLTGVYVDVPVASTARESYIVVTGSNNAFIGGTFEDTYPNSLIDVTDFVSYNNDSSLSFGLRGEAVMSILGDDNVIDGIKLTIRGSFPYGYGSIFGIGSSNSFGLNKRCGIVIKGDSNTIENSEIQQRAFCHGIYMQSPADNTTIRNTLVEGTVRETNNMLMEGEGSLPYRADYRTVDGDPIPADEVNSLSEDGIRVYTGGGSVVVENCTVKKMRGGIRLYLASSASVSNSTATDNGMTNFNMPKGGTVTDSRGNFTYAPLSDFRLSRSNQNLQITILPSPNAIGSHNIADILGSSHNIVFHRADGPEDTQETRVIKVYGNNSTIRNETEYTIVLESGTSGNTIISAGDVTDFGANNVSRIDLAL